MAPTVYLETSIISYLAARPSRDLITAAHQQLTADWWLRRRPSFRVFISEVVVQESGLGDQDAALRRIDALTGIPLLQLTTEAKSLASALVEDKIVPGTAAVDALHIAVAAENGMEYLLTWNCKHIANARTRVLIEHTLRSRGYDPPVLCTPEELMED